jgi:type I restriction enzyme S subunit
MIEGLKPYPEYKESGSKWLGKVPSQWEAVPLGRPLVQRIEQNRPVKTKEILSLSLRQGVVPYSEKKSGGNKAKDDLTAYTLAYPGDIVVNSMNVVVGSVGLSKYFGAVSPVYYVLHTRSDKDSILFFDALFQDKTFQQSLWGLGNGILFLQSKTTGKFNTIRMRIPMHALRRVVIPQPPPGEQVAIVRFLDHANRKIDGFIRAKRKLIGLLNGQKQAIIHRAVTRGLQPDVPLKPSGIPWLGDIPQHWEARRVKQATRILRGKFSHRPRNDPSFYDGPYPFIQTGAVAQADKFITSYKQTLNEKGLSVSKLFPSGTLLMTIAANIGDVAILTFAACFPDSIVGFVPVGKLDRDYLYFVFRCMKGELLREAPVNTQGNLNVERIGIMWMPLPPLSEQEQITRYIESETAPFDTAIARTEREIALMQEYRTRLTADLVTGKLDVREAAAHLPEPPAEPSTEEVLEDFADECEPDENPPP